MWFILVILHAAVSIGVGEAETVNGNGEAEERKRLTRDEMRGDLRLVPIHWSNSHWRNNGGDLMVEVPLVLASKHTVQSEIAKRDEKKMKSKKPFYNKYFAELLVAMGVLILLVLFLCWFNVSRKKRRRGARKHDTVTSYAKGVVLDPQEFGENGEKKLLGECRRTSVILPPLNAPRVV